MPGTICPSSFIKTAVVLGVNTSGCQVQQWQSPLQAEIPFLGLVMSMNWPGVQARSYVTPLQSSCHSSAKVSEGVDISALTFMTLLLFDLAVSLIWLRPWQVIMQSPTSSRLTTLSVNLTFSQLATPILQSLIGVALRPINLIRDTHSQISLSIERHQMRP